MTETTERKRVPALVTVKAKAEAEDGYKLELDIPAFKSSYPTIVTRVPQALAAKLAVGQRYNVTLEQQNLKRGKNGDRPFDYYYGLLGLSDFVAAAPPAPPAPQEHVATNRDETRTSIERQKALDIAERLYSRFAVEDGITINEHSIRLLHLATRFATWMETGAVPRIAPVRSIQPQGANEATAPDAEQGDTPF